MTAERRKETRTQPPFRDRATQVFVDVFTRHVWAKIFSLLVASIIVYLIDRELMQPVLYERLAVVVEDVGNPNSIIVTLPAGFVLMPDPGQSAPMTDIRIRVREKERDRIHLPFRASIPQSRADSVVANPERQGRVSLERGDIVVQGISGPVEEMDAVSLRIAQVETRELRVAAESLVIEDFDLTVTFVPDIIAVTGPFSEVATLDRIEVPLKLPGDNGEDATQLKSFPERYTKRQIRMVEPRIIAATVKKSPREHGDLEVFNVRIRIVKAQNFPYEFKLGQIYEGEVMPKVVLTGSKPDIDACRADPKALEAELVILVMGERAVEREQAAIDASTDPEGVTIEARALIPQQFLDKFKLRLKEPNLRIPVKVRRIAGS